MNPLRLVLDTNVVLDLLHFRDASVEPIRRAVEGGAAVCFTNPICSDELVHVLGYPRFKLEPPAARRLIADYAALARNGNPYASAHPAPLPVCADPDDQKFLELARAVAADLLVTKDKALLALARKKHRLSGFRIVTPAQAAAELGGSGGQPGPSAKQRP